MFRMRRKPTRQWNRIKDKVNNLLDSLKELEPSLEKSQDIVNWTVALENMHDSTINILISELEKEKK